MILAPRSWPSRPGFATTTRYLALALAHRGKRIPPRLTGRDAEARARAGLRPPKSVSATIERR